MVITFYNPISEDFYKRLHNSCDLEEKTDVYIDNIHEFLSIVQTFELWILVSLIWKGVRLDFFLNVWKVTAKV